MFHDDRIGLYLLICLLVTWPATADLPPAGAEFWLAWPETADVRSDDIDYDLDGEIVILTSSTVPVQVSVEASGLNWNGPTALGNPAVVRVPFSLKITSDGVVEQKGIHVWSTDCGEISVLFRVPAAMASVGDDTMTILPATNLGMVYYPDTYHGGGAYTDGDGNPAQAGSEFAVLAIEDNTQVTWDNPFCPGLTQVTLNRGEVIQHKCQDDPPNVIQRGIVGSRVEADRPVAVFGASGKSNIINYYIDLPGTPLNIIWAASDVLLEQMRPTHDWEYEYRTTPFLGGASWAGDLFRIIATCDDTVVEVDDGTDLLSNTMQAGENWDLIDVDLFTPSFGLTLDPLIIRADHPVQVTQYMVGWDNADQGDPSQVMVPGLFRSSGTTLVYLKSGYENHINVIVPAPSSDQVLLDGVPISPASWQPYPDGVYVWARLSNLADGQHIIFSDDPISVTVYGYTLTDEREYTAGGYAYPAPSSGVDEPFPALITRSSLCELQCPGDCLTLDAGAGYASYLWSTGETIRDIT
ncbi:IgGFc-binding protein, partial [Acidobacteriota bacterium]